MRIWSLHPKYLDTKGLVACWRETLLAKNVLEGKTKGYTQHPQLIRFKLHPNPIAAIHFYLSIVHQEACARAYKFDSSKFFVQEDFSNIPVTNLQVDYEFQHLLRKLLERDIHSYHQYQNLMQVEVHPLFYTVPGEIESWEVISGYEKVKLHGTRI